MKKVETGKHGIYEYRGYRIWCHGYYPPDKCIWWEAINQKTQNADFHEHRLKDIIKRINETTNL